MHDEFEWDDIKNLANQRKHNIAFEDAVKVFSDPYQMDSFDDTVDEIRFNALGMADARLIHVTYTLRGNICRVISARGATPHEKRMYHEIQA